MHTRGSPPRPPGLGFGEHDYVPTTETTRVTIAATSVMPALSSRLGAVAFESSSDAAGPYCIRGMHSYGSAITTRSASWPIWMTGGRSSARA